ncbi:MAG: uncharacterized OsmC-like protein/fermentation-respiration switch protein FrsA (DUF1100 family) [Myxococcota bacterium]|jgi:uncharacterized OsmC-like protein/fermentation-respiration switch protein FrsA (DUF1100 family)
MANDRRRISFPGADGSSLSARLDRPAEGPIRAYALFAHCFTCSKDLAAAGRIARELTEHGIAVLRFDFTGLGHSGGEFSDTCFSSNVGDLVAAAAYMREELQAPSILIGHSLGGAAVLAAAGDIPEAVAVSTIGAPADPAHVAHLFADSREDIERDGSACVSIGGRPFRIRQEFLKDIESHRLQERVGSLGKALLIFHAPGDTIVGVDNAARLYRAASHPKSFVSLDDADHLLSARRDAAYVGTVLAAWASRYVPGAQPEPAEASAPAAEVPHGTVVVSESGVGKFGQTVQAGKHAFVADEPISVGGLDTGPGPYDLLLAALGACTSMTLRMYAAHKGIALGKVSIRLQHEKIHARDCDDCESEKGFVDVIRREITMDGDLEPAVRERLLQIADRCPVHKTLHNEIRVETTDGGTGSGTGSGMGSAS